MESVSNGRLNGLVGKPAKGKAPAESKGKASKAKHLRSVERWGTRYVATACVLSSGLNAWANVDLCGSENAVACAAAGGLGAVVPVLVWMLGKVAGHAYRGGKRGLAYAVGVAGVALLVLSVWHCAHAIAVLTGGGLLLSGLLAVGIDYGLVASEVAAVTVEE